VLVNISFNKIALAHAAYFLIITLKFKTVTTAGVEMTFHGDKKKGAWLLANAENRLKNWLVPPSRSL
jgi:hypothetical protein